MNFIEFHVKHQCFNWITNKHRTFTGAFLHLYVKERSTSNHRPWPGDWYKKNKPKRTKNSQMGPRKQAEPDYSNLLKLQDEGFNWSIRNSFKKEQRKSNTFFQVLYFILGNSEEKKRGGRCQLFMLFYFSNITYIITVCDSSCFFPQEGKKKGWGRVVTSYRFLPSPKSLNFTWKLQIKSINTPKHRV